MMNFEKSGNIDYALNNCNENMIVENEITIYRKMI